MEAWLQLLPRKASYATEADMIFHEQDKNTPGGVYLCQTDTNVSCGACCGLYNVNDPSFENLSKILQTRTEIFQKTSRDFDSIEGFRETVESIENQSRPYPLFHHCPYIGFVGENLSRPGCLLHPLNHGNNGVDHRGHSQWGGFACATYFCPTCSTLPERFKTAVRLSCKNWYIYGLVVTETEMLRNFFTILENMLSKEIDVTEISENKSFLDSVNDFLQLKKNWPYRPPLFNHHGNYFFKDGLYKRTPIDYLGLDAQHSPFDSILTALGSEFSSKNDLVCAEEKIFHIIDRAVSAVK